MQTLLPAKLSKQTINIKIGSHIVIHRRKAKDFSIRNILTCENNFLYSTTKLYILETLQVKHKLNQLSHQQQATIN